MFNPKIQSYINSSGEAQAKMRAQQLNSYIETLYPTPVNNGENTTVKPFNEVLKVTKEENGAVFEVDKPPQIPFGSLSRKINYTKDEILDLIDRTAQKYGIDEKLVRALVKQESGFNPNAKSHAGALGLMQLMPSTAQGLGVKNPLDPVQNVEGGVKYLKSMLDRFNGNTILALAAYNAGPNAVKKYNGVPHYKETQNYVRSILRKKKKKRIEDMQNGITPKINLTDRIEFSKLDSMQGFSSARLDGIEEAQTTDFNGVLTGLVEQLNQTVNAPEQLTQDAMLGKADVHDVMAAVAKSEINVNIATKVLGKVVQTYEKIMQIQI